MDKATKEQFIRDLCDSIRDSILAKVPKMPDDWNGHQLRQYIADTTRELAGASLKGKDHRSYQNEAITRGL